MPICSRDVRGQKASDWLRTAGACLRQLPTMRLNLTGSPLERGETGRVRTGRAREAGDGAAEPRQQPAARMETGVKFACASLARTMLFQTPNSSHPRISNVPHALLAGPGASHQPQTTRPHPHARVGKHPNAADRRHSTFVAFCRDKGGSGSGCFVLFVGRRTRGVSKRGG